MPNVSYTKRSTQKLESVPTSIKLKKYQSNKKKRLRLFTGSHYQYYNLFLSTPYQKNVTVAMQQNYSYNLDETSI